MTATPVFRGNDHRAVMKIWADSTGCETGVRAFSGSSFRWEEVGSSEEAEGQGRERTQQRSPNQGSATDPGCSPQQCDPNNTQLAPGAQGLAGRRHTNGCFPSSLKPSLQAALSQKPVLSTCCMPDTCGHHTTLQG